MPTNIIPISSPNELPGKILSGWLCKTVDEAIQRAAGRKAWLYESRVLQAWYLFVDTPIPARME